MKATFAVTLFAPDEIAAECVAMRDRLRELIEGYVIDAAIDTRRQVTLEIGANDPADPEQSRLMPRIPILPAPDNSLPYETLRGRGHTALPWVLGDPHKAAVYSDDATGSIIAKCDGFQFAPRPREEAEANAAFIFRACNAHDDLVAALKAAYGAVNDAFGQANAEYQGLDHLASKYDDKIRAFREQARAAIAKATGAQS